MILAQRLLTCATSDGDVAVAVTLHAPSQGERDWSCRYEIDWPEQPRRGHGYGIDATQPLSLALQAIGADLYTSEWHASGRLRWTEPGRGYGYPVPKTIRDLLVGDDVGAFG